MGKKVLFLVPICVALVLALVVAGAALAQTTTPGTPAQPGQPAQPAQPGLKGFFGGFGRMFGLGGGQNRWTGFDAEAKALGLTPDQLFTDLHNGQTIAQIAQAQGKNLSDVQAAVKAANEQALKDAIQQAVTDKRITQDQANWLLQGLQNGWLGRGFGGIMGLGKAPGMMPGLRPNGGTKNGGQQNGGQQNGTGSGTGFRRGSPAPSFQRTGGTF